MGRWPARELQGSQPGKSRCGLRRLRKLFPIQRARGFTNRSAETGKVNTKPRRIQSRNSENAERSNREEKYPGRRGVINNYRGAGKCGLSEKIGPKAAFCSRRAQQRNNARDDHWHVTRPSTCTIFPRRTFSSQTRSTSTQTCRSSRQTCRIQNPDTLRAGRVVVYRSAGTAASLHASPAGITGSSSHGWLHPVAQLVPPAGLHRHRVRVLISYKPALRGFLQRGQRLAVFAARDGLRPFPPAAWGVH